MKITRVTRIVKILTALQSGQNYDAQDLAKLFNTSRRTVFRDLKELQAIGVPYQFDKKNRKYSIDPEFFLPPIDLNLTEALSLLLLVHKAGNQIQLPFKNSALIGALKIENNLPANIRQYCETALKNISTKFTPQAVTNLLDKTFADLKKAILKKQKITLNYDSLFDKKVITTELSPYHLMYNRRAWYVIGFSKLHNEIRTFKLNRIKSIGTLDRKYIEDSFDLNDYLSKAWSMIPEGTLYNVKLHFTPKVARNVAEVQWHATQQAEFQPDGSVILEFRVDGLNEIYWWILGYGDQVNVIAPKKLKTKIHKTAKNILSQDEKV